MWQLISALHGNRVDATLSALVCQTEMMQKNCPACWEFESPNILASHSLSFHAVHLFMHSGLQCQTAAQARFFAKINTALIWFISIKSSVNRQRHWCRAEGWTAALYHLVHQSILPTLPVSPQLLSRKHKNETQHESNQQMLSKRDLWLRYWSCSNYSRAMTLLHHVALLPPRLSWFTPLLQFGNIQTDDMEALAGL